MAGITIAVVVGSIRKDSYNRQFADALVKLAPADVKFEFIRIDDLPLYDQDDDASPAPEVARLRERILAATGVLFVTPEYNRSMPGVLKNAIDHASRPYGKNTWKGKPVGVCGVSVGAAGTCMAQQHLRNVIAYLDMAPLGQPEMFIQWKDGLVVDGQIGPNSREFVQTFVDTLLAWVKRFA